MVYHVWFGRVSGGVDVFFVITGFLLTGQLARVDAPSMEFVLRRWRRTFVRLTPAACTVLVGTVVLAAGILPEGRWAQTIREVVASALYLENWQLVADSVDYAARSNAVSTVQHFWSLSIQGQFSLIWPVFLAAVVLTAGTVAAHRRTRLTAALLGVFVVSLTVSVVRTAADQPVAYFHTATRLWEFALGGLLALWIDRVRLGTAVRVALGWVGILGLIACGIVLQVDALFPGAVALWPTTCAALVLLAGHTRVPWAADRLLTSAGARYLGDLSYALYLWHWPLLVLYLGGGGLDGVGLLDGLVVIAAALVLAALTHHLVERPMTARTDARALRWCATGLVVVLALAATWQAVAYAKANPDGAAGDREHPGAAALFGPPPPQADLLPAPVSVYDDFVRYDEWDCAAVPGFDSQVCTQPVTYVPAKRIVVVGDSHSQQMLGALIPLAAQHRWQLITMIRGACPFSTTSDSDPNNTTCVPFHDATMDVVSELRPDAVVAIGTRDVRVGPTETIPPGYVDAWRQVTDLGIPMVAVRDNPRFDYSVPDCASGLDRGDPECGVDRAAVYTAAPPWAGLDGLPGGVGFVDIADAVCDQQRCPAEIGNVLVYLDDNHLSATYATTMAGPLERQFLDAVGR